jgi:hypothetical protein
MYLILLNAPFMSLHPYASTVVARSSDMVWKQKADFIVAIIALKKME